MTDLTSQRLKIDGLVREPLGDIACGARVYVFAPSQLAHKISNIALQVAEDACVCPNVGVLLNALSLETIAVVCAESLLTEEALIFLSKWVRDQPSWSDLPFFILAEKLSPERRRRLVRSLGNAAFLAIADESGLRVALQAAQHSWVRRWRVREIMDRQLADLRQSEKNIRTVLETAYQDQSLLGPSGEIIYVNTTALNGIDIKLEHLVGQPFWDSPWFSSTPGMSYTVREAIGQVAVGRTVAMKMTLQFASGEKLYDFSIRPVFGVRDEVICIIAEGIDITARVQAEDGLRQAQKMEAVGQLTGGVAHDFNNLLTVIKSSSELLKRPDLSESKRQRYITAIADTTDRAARLTSQLLAFARRQTLQPKVFDISASVTGVSDMVSTLCGSRIELVTQLPDKPCFVDADPSQFETALVNMVVNARDAMGGVGRLTIRVECLPGIPAVRTHPAVKAPYMSVSVQDSGVGMAPDMLGKIFEPFFTTKNVGEGTGLGLSQVFGFAKQSEGEVVVKSMEGEGSTFTLYLRRVGAPTTVEPDLVLDDLEAGHGSYVLVVEDNRAVGQFVTHSLEELGYRSRWVGNARDALEALDEEGGDHDIVFTDVVMPGMDGLALGQEIRRRYPGMPVVLSSGYSEVLMRERDHGFDLLQKPYSVEQLSKALRLAVARQRADIILPIDVTSPSIDERGG